MKPSQSPLAKKPKPKKEAMFQRERHEKILALLDQQKKVTIEALSQAFRVSLVTARADVKALAQRGLLIRTHGGALSIQRSIHMEIPFGVRSVQHVREKQAIGKAAARMVADHDIIMLDSGSTTLEVARAITAKNVTVITNDIKIGTLIAERGDMTLIMPGGVLLPSVYALTGNETSASLERMKVNKLFLGCDAIDFGWGVSNRTIQEVAVKQTMMRSAKEVIAVADQSKFGQQVFAHVCNITDLHMLICDALSAQQEEFLTQHGVAFLIAPGDGG